VIVVISMILASAKKILHFPVALSGVRSLKTNEMPLGVNNFEFEILEHNNLYLEEK
jgi:hypothetical protein